MWTNNHHSFQHTSFHSTAFTHGLASVAGLQPCVAYSRHLGTHGATTFGCNPILPTLNFTPMPLNPMPLPFVNQIPQPANPFAMNIMQPVPIMTPCNPTQLLFNQLPLPITPMPMPTPVRPIPALSAIQQCMELICQKKAEISDIVPQSQYRTPFNRIHNHFPNEIRMDPPDIAPEHNTTFRRPRADNSDGADMVPRFRNRMSFSRRCNNSPIETRLDPPDIHAAPDHITTVRRARADNFDSADIVPPSRHRLPFTRRHNHSPSGMRMDPPDTAPDQNTTERRPRADTSIADMVTRFRNRMSFNKRRNNSPIETMFDPLDIAPDHNSTGRRSRADNSDSADIVPLSRYRPPFTRRHNHSPSGMRMNPPEITPEHNTTERRPRADNSDRVDIPSFTHRPTDANRRITNSRSRATNNNSNNNTNNTNNNGRGKKIKKIIKFLPIIEETVDDSGLPNNEYARLQRSRISNSDNRIPTANITVRSRNRPTSIRNDPERSNPTSSVREDGPPDHSTTSTVASTQSNNAAYVAASEASVREATRRSRHGTSSRRSSRQSRECVVCKDDEKRRDCYLRDCGHFVTCMDCAGRLQHCPVCRKPIKERLRVYT